MTTDNETKFCKDCKYAKTESDNPSAYKYAFCIHPSSKKEVDPVDGSESNSYCTVMRTRNHACGPSGKLWELKDEFDFEYEQEEKGPSNYYSPTNFDKWSQANRQWEKDRDALRVAYQNACHNFAQGKIDSEQFAFIKSERDNHKSLEPNPSDWDTYSNGSGGGYYHHYGYDAGMWAAIHGSAIF